VVIAPPVPLVLLPPAPVVTFIDGAFIDPHPTTMSDDAMANRVADRLAESGADFAVIIGGPPIRPPQISATAIRRPQLRVRRDRDRNLFPTQTIRNLGITRMSARLRELRAVALTCVQRRTPNVT
jgi:hypothetical protein